MKLEKVLVACFGRQLAPFIVTTFHDAMSLVAISFMFFIVSTILETLFGGGSHPMVLILVTYIHEATLILSTVAIAAVTLKNITNVLITIIFRKSSRPDESI